MAEAKKTVIGRAETLEEILKRKHTIQELLTASQKYIDDLDRVDVLAKTSKADVKGRNLEEISKEAKPVKTKRF